MPDYNASLKTTNSRISNEFSKALYPVFITLEFKVDNFQLATDFIVSIFGDKADILSLREVGK